MEFGRIIKIIGGILYWLMPIELGLSIMVVAWVGVSN